MIKALVLVLAISIGLFVVVEAFFLLLPPSLKTMLTPNFSPDVWNSDITFNTTQTQARAMLGDPFYTDPNTRCDFYSQPRLHWGKFIEYKVCYDQDLNFFLKYMHIWGILPLIPDGI